MKVKSWTKHLIVYLIIKLINCVYFTPKSCLCRRTRGILVKWAALRPIFSSFPTLRHSSSLVHSSPSRHLSHSRRESISHNQFLGFPELIKVHLQPCLLQQLCCNLLSLGHASTASRLSSAGVLWGQPNCFGNTNSTWNKTLKHHGSGHLFLPFV